MVNRKENFKHKYTTEEFIEKAIKIHGDKYDYSKVKYVNSTTKVCIICPEHGEFWQQPSSHLSGVGCRKCGSQNAGNKNRFNKNDFVKKAIKIHNGKYNYSKVEYINALTKVCIICPEHGEFWQRPSGHLNGYGCPKCSDKRNGLVKRLSTEEFIEKARKVHGDKYDYSNVEYIKSSEKVCIICPEHGEFLMTPHSHLIGQGCKKCGFESVSKKNSKSQEEWIRECEEKHSHKYDYSVTNYTGYYNYVDIICPIHGKFTQLAYDHQQGKGCPKCKTSWLEKEIITMLDENNIEYIYQYRSRFLSNNKSHKSIDFYLPDIKLGIECQGIQHFKEVDFFYKNSNVIEQDIVKKEICNKNGIKLIYYTHEKTPEEYLGLIFKDINEIKDFILNEKGLL